MVSSEDLDKLPIEQGVMDAKGSTNKTLITEDTGKVENHSNGYNETKAFLLPKREGMSKNPGRVRRKVQWNDNSGNKLAEVLVFEPSDSEEEKTESCICTVM